MEKLQKIITKTLSMRDRNQQKEQWTETSWKSVVEKRIF